MARLLRCRETRAWHPEKYFVSPSPYDEMRTPEGEIRPQYHAFAGWLDRTASERIAQKREEAERAFHRVGITFAVYGEDSGTARLIPFDLVPRILGRAAIVDAARRHARFWAHGHTPGGMKLTDEPPNPATPTTLDLRWQPHS